MKGKKNPNRIEINSEEAYSNCCSVINCKPIDYIVTS